MQREDMLIELGVEEIPASYIEPAVEKLSRALEEQFKGAGLQYNRISKYSTPRRFGVKVDGLEIEQQDEVIERVGPSIEIAYDKEGKLSKAAQGFLRGAQASVEDIYEVDSKKGKKLAVRLEKKGKKTIELLPVMVKTAVQGINFPKTMRWGTGKMMFARPIRWLICFLGDKRVDLEINGIKSGITSYGNRYRQLVNPVEINSSSAYPACLEKVQVIADRDKRKDLINEQLIEIEQKSGLEIIPNEPLKETVVNLVEYPTATLGNFDAKYLRLPEKIIISTLSANQKCFALRSSNGKLADKFIFTNNGDPASEEMIRHGNEKVIGARLADAEFYYQEDTGKPFENYVEKLDEVLFQKDLGSLREKTERIVKLSEYICDELGISGEEKSKILRTGYLCKADLVTQMLGEKEFTKLQGYIGMKYAIASGEDELVAEGISEHYQPKGQSDQLPQTQTGRIIALADKLDTVCGIMGVGLLPTGSNDPFALRRAANGIVRILADQGLQLDLEKTIEKSFQLLKAKLAEPDNNLTKVKEYFEQRISWFLKQSGIGYDVIDSVMHIDQSNIPELLNRAKAVEQFRTREDFIRLVLGFKRVSNIIASGQKFGEIKTDLLQEEAEQLLYQGYQKLAEKLAGLDRNYLKMLEELVDYSGAIDRFFDEVLVNVDDEILRQNRYNLLRRIREEFLRVSDLALIVVEEKN